MSPLNPDQLAIYRWLTADRDRRAYWAQQALHARRCAAKRRLVKRGLVTAQAEAVAILARVLQRDASVVAIEERQEQSWPLLYEPIAERLLLDLRKGAAAP